MRDLAALNGEKCLDDLFGRVFDRIIEGHTRNWLSKFGRSSNECEFEIIELGTHFVNSEA